VANPCVPLFFNLVEEAGGRPFLSVRVLHPRSVRRSPRYRRNDTSDDPYGSWNKPPPPLIDTLPSLAAHASRKRAKCFRIFE